MISKLESRVLLAGVTTDLTAGLLTVRGTAHTDDISIDVLQNGVTVKDAGVVIFSTPIFSTDVFAGIVVKARGGHDTVAVNSNEATFRTSVFGQAGRDTLTVLSFHGPGGFVSGGSGNDTITTDTELAGGGGVGADIRGGSGRDTITTTAGAGSTASNVSGGSSDDDITVRSLAFIAGGHTVHGNAGDDAIRALGDPVQLLFGSNDQLFGDAGRDRISAGLGDDTMDGGAGKDTLDGEGGTDTAEDSNQDTFLNVENFV